MKESATRDHEPVDAANRASRTIALGAATLRPKASSAPPMLPHRSPSVRPAFARAAAPTANLRFSPRRRTRNAAFAAHERNASSLALPVALQEQNSLGVRQSSRPFHFSTPPPFPVPRIKTVLLLMKQVKSQRETKNFSCAAKAAFVSLRLAPLLGHPLRGRPTAGGYEGRRPKGSGGAWRSRI